MPDYFGMYDAGSGPPDPHGRSRALWPEAFGTLPDDGLSVEEEIDFDALEEAIDAEVDAWIELFAAEAERKAKRRRS
jgi:hypothetical protein